MRQILMAALIVSLLPLTAWAQTPEFVLGQPLTAQWEPPTNETEAAVTRYEVRYNADPTWANSGLTVGQPTYVLAIPANRRPLGSHTFRVRACSAQGCGPELTAAYTIVRPLPGMPRAPGGGVIRPTAGESGFAPMTLATAERYAQAYALWRIDRHLAPAEIGWLAARWPAGQRLDKLSLLAFLDSAPWPTAHH